MPRKALSANSEKTLKSDSGSWYSKACGVDASCAYAMPPAITAAAIIRVTNTAILLRVINSPPERFSPFHAPPIPQFQISLTIEAELPGSKLLWRPAIHDVYHIRRGAE